MEPVNVAVAHRSIGDGQFGPLNGASEVKAPRTVRTLLSPPASAIAVTDIATSVAAMSEAKASGFRVVLLNIESSLVVVRRCNEM
jgi:hypothetical protein